MAILSEGGLTSPDIFIVILLNLIALISIILNPLVFKHNISKKRSIARDLYLVLSASDFTSSVVISSSLSAGIAAPKEEQCSIDHNATFCHTEYYKYNRTATVTEKAVGGVLWSLSFIPMITAAVLALSRWYQISYPLRPFNRNAVEIILGICCLLLLVNFQKFLFKESSGNPVVFKMNVQTVTYLKRTNFLETLPYSFVLLFTLISSLASVVTVWNIFKSPAVPGNERIRAKRIKGALKIALVNFGTVAWDGVVFTRLFAGEESDLLYIVQATWCFLPIVLSTYNPIVYTMLTTGVYKIHNNKIRGFKG